MVLAVVPRASVWATLPTDSVSVRPPVRVVPEVAASVTSNAALVSRKANVPTFVIEVLVPEIVGLVAVKVAAERPAGSVVEIEGTPVPEVTSTPLLPVARLPSEPAIS